MTNCLEKENRKQAIYLLFTRIVIVIFTAYGFHYIYKINFVLMIISLISDCIKNILLVIFEFGSVYFNYVKNFIKLFNLPVIKWDLVKNFIKSSLSEKKQLFKYLIEFLSTFFERDKMKMGDPSSIDIKNNLIKQNEISHSHVAMMNSMDNIGGGDINNANLANNNTNNTNNQTPVEVELIIGDDIGRGVLDKYNIVQPDTNENLSRAEYAQRLADYLEKAKKYKQQTIWKGEHNHWKVSVTHAGLRNHNKLFLQNVIQNNPGTAPHKALTGSRGIHNNMSNVYITNTLIDILRKTS